jgi:pyruvate/2-oxoacid:ferredoxin oxidoreductase alpha subunit
MGLANAPFVTTEANRPISSQPRPIFTCQGDLDSLTRRFGFSLHAAEAAKAENTQTAIHTKTRIPVGGLFLI